MVLAGLLLPVLVAAAPVLLVAGPTCKSIPASLLAKAFLTADPFFLLRFDPEGFGLFTGVAPGPLEHVLFVFRFGEWRVVYGVVLLGVLDVSPSVIAYSPKLSKRLSALSGVATMLEREDPL